LARPAVAIVRTSIERHHDEAISTRLDGTGSAFLVSILFMTSGARLDLHALFSEPVTLVMVPIYALLMLPARGVPALLLYRSVLSRRFVLRWPSIRARSSRSSSRSPALPWIAG
jgi:Kef-type K+ transport system membrane component KefB